MTRHALLLLAIAAAATGCRSGDGIGSGTLLKGVYANMQDERAYAEASPADRFDIDDRPGGTSQSWQTAERDYPGALPGR